MRALLILLPLLLAADYPLPCSGPEHAQRRHEPGWREPLGRLTSDRPATARQLSGYLCEACARVQQQRLSEVGRLVLAAAREPDGVRARQLVLRAAAVRSGVVGAAPPTEAELGQMRQAYAQTADRQAEMRRLWIVALLPAAVFGLFGVVLLALVRMRRLAASPRTR